MAVKHAVTPENEHLVAHHILAAYGIAPPKPNPNTTIKTALALVDRVQAEDNKALRSAPPSTKPMAAKIMAIRTGE